MKKLLALLMTLLLVFALPLAVMAEDADTAEDETFRCTCENCVPEEEEAPSTEDGPKTTFGFFPETLSKTLPIMGMGMLGILLVTIVIVLAVVILSKIGRKSQED